MNRYGAPTTYKRITPDRGSGFILKSIYELTEAPGLIAPQWPTKKDVYFGTQWYNRPDFASLLWSSLIKDGLIESNGGIQNYKYHGWYSSKDKIGYRATGSYEFGRGYTVRYHLTPKGRGVLFDMMDRVNKIRKEKKAFCERNGIEFGMGRTLNTVGSVAEYDAKKDEKVAPPPTPVKRDILEKEALDCAKLVADYAAENRKLRAEKNDLLTSLENAYHRVALLETEIQGLKAELNWLVDWVK